MWLWFLRAAVAAVAAAAPNGQSGLQAFHQVNPAKIRLDPSFEKDDSAMQAAEIARRVEALFSSMAAAGNVNHHSAIKTSQDAFLRKEPPVEGRRKGSTDRAQCFGSRAAPVTLLTLAVNLNAEYKAGMHKNRLKEAEGFGYEYCEYEMALDSSRDIAWSKVKAIQALLDLGRRIVVWLDADALFMNFKPFQPIYQGPFSEGKSLVFTGGESSPVEVNSGVLIVKNSKDARAFWESIWNDFPEAIDHMWWENQAILLYLRQRPLQFNRIASVVPLSTMNSIPGQASAPGDQAFVVHVAGGHAEGKYEKMAAEYMQPGCQCCC